MIISTILRLIFYKPVRYKLLKVISLYDEKNSELDEGQIQNIKQVDTYFVLFKERLILQLL